MTFRDASNGSTSREYLCLLVKGSFEFETGDKPRGTQFLPALWGPRRGGARRGQGSNHVTTWCNVSHPDTNRRYVSTTILPFTSHQNPKNLGNNVSTELRRLLAPFESVSLPSLEGSLPPQPKKLKSPSNVFILSPVYHLGIALSHCVDIGSYQIALTSHSVNLAS